MLEALGRKNFDDCSKKSLSQTFQPLFNHLHKLFVVIKTSIFYLHIFVSYKIAAVISEMIRYMCTMWQNYTEYSQRYFLLPWRVLTVLFNFSFQQNCKWTVLYFIQFDQTLAIFEINFFANRVRNSKTFCRKSS